jgi:hypothetical protein
MTARCADLTLCGVTKGGKTLPTPVPIGETRSNQTAGAGKFGKYGDGRQAMRKLRSAMH